MRIHSLSIRNVRGIEQLDLSGLPETGVIVIHGDNEQGKSTTVEALRTVLMEKHGTTRKEVKALQPVGRDESPTVTLHATIGPHTFTITKNWLRRAKSELNISTPRRENHTGREADERLEEIIREHLDENLLQVLFMSQEDLGETISAVGIPSLTKALDGYGDDGGEADAGTEDTALLAAVEKEYTRYWSAKRGDAANDLKNAHRACEDARTEHTAAQAGHRELQGFVDRHDRVSERRDRDAAALPGAEAEETELAQKSEVARQAHEKATHLRRELQLATEAHQRAGEAVAQRGRLRLAVTQAEEELELRSRGLEEAQHAAEQEHTQLQQLGEQLAAAKLDLEKTAGQLREARRHQRLVTAAARRAELSAQLSQVGELNERVRALREQAGGRQLTDADVTAVEEATTEVTLQRRLREQTAAKLELGAPAGTQITVDGESRTFDSAPLHVELAQGTELTLGEITARYLPGRDETSGTDPVAAAGARLADLLAELGLPDLPAVRAAREQARTAAEELAQLLRERTGLLGGADEETLAAELARLDQELAEVELPEIDAAAAARAVEDAEQAEEEARKLIDVLGADLAPWQERKAQTTLTTLSVRIEAAEANLAAAQQSLAEAVDRAGDEILETALLECGKVREGAEARSRDAEAEVAAVDPELAESLHLGAQERVESLEASISEAELTLRELQGRIEQATGAAERLDKAAAALAAAQHQFGSVSRRAEAVRLLRGTLHRHRDAARARYARPFAEQLTSLARTVFGPQVEFSLSEDLEVTQRSIGADTVPVDGLSAGAKEQLAILTRFAIAGLTSRESVDGTVPVPVIIDDALGSTDQGRLGLMATLFSQMGRTSQVIVLTCEPQRYNRVVGRTEYAIEDLKSSGMLL
ncbi:ATP-binding protein [Corynebacterium sp. YIM 101645]|uniref:ATP-binding protein n=1 Tax=Corynebacterium lemuris TaxID=1859292 RepID=A0ABT2FY48_9CORY|nr:ATP-binding protein [Corynebacterium lemuris]MCS5478957.1 ATP-binding protein [Corynebacterium lemuris]